MNHDGEIGRVLVWDVVNLDGKNLSNLKKGTKNVLYNNVESDCSIWINWEIWMSGSDFEYAAIFCYLLLFHVSKNKITYNRCREWDINNITLLISRPIIKFNIPFYFSNYPSSFHRWLNSRRKIFSFQSFLTWLRSSSLDFYYFLTLFFFFFCFICIYFTYLFFPISTLILYVLLFFRYHW